MKTREEYAEYLTPKFISDITVGMLSSFRRVTRQEVEDIVQNALVEVGSKIQYINDIGAAVWEVARLRMIDYLRLRIDREHILKGYRRQVPRIYNPWRAIDFKIDLERAIKRVGAGAHQRAALWHIMYEGYQVDDIAAVLPPPRRQREWIRRLWRLRQKVRRALRDMEYRG